MISDGFGAQLSFPLHVDLHSRELEMENYCSKLMLPIKSSGLPDRGLFRACILLTRRSCEHVPDTSLPVR
jgi:hypothetical protein